MVSKPTLLSLTTLCLALPENKSKTNRHIFLTYHLQLLNSEKIIYFFLNYKTVFII